jgi:hypothetical protein
MRNIKKAEVGARSRSSVNGPVIAAIDDFLRCTNQIAPRGEHPTLTAAALRELAAAAIALALLEEFDGEKGQDDHMALLQKTFASVQHRAVELFGEFSRHAPHPSELN